MGEPTSTLPPLPPPPEPVAELCMACVRFVKEALDLELDFTQDTLPILDHYLRENAAEASDELQGLLAPAAGAYFGEVVRQELRDGRWHSPDADYRSWRLEFDRVFLHFNPVGIAFEVIEQDDTAGWGAHLQVLPEARTAVESALEHSSEVRTRDYYSFSIRFETVEQVASILAGLDARSGKGPRQFSAQVYRAAAGDGTDTPSDQAN